MYVCAGACVARALSPCSLSISSLIASPCSPLHFAPSAPPSYDQVFKSLSPIHRTRSHTEPYCTDIIELPFSVFSMDHLSGVQDRHSYDSLEGTHREEEKELKEVRGEVRESDGCGCDVLYSERSDEGV